MSTTTTTFLDNLAAWSRQAARAQLDSQVPLTETIGKIAQQQQLGTEQVRRLCEAANHEVYAELFQTGDEALFSFPVADYTTVLSQLHVGQSDDPSKQADGDLSDYDRPPTDLATDAAGILDHVFAHMFPKAAEPSQGYQERSRPDRARLLLNRKMEALSELQSRKIAAELAMDTAQQQLYQRVRQAILSGQSIEDIYQVLHDLHPASDLTVAGGVFDEVLERLKAENLVDPRTVRQDLTCEPRLINRDSPVARSVVSYQKEARRRRIADRAMHELQDQIGDLRHLLCTSRKAEVPR